MSVDLILGGRSFDSETFLIMAIVNRTPDSFYDKGASFADADAIQRVTEAVDAGADIIDIGGVKAGPGQAVDAAEEIRRTASFVADVRSSFPDVIISVDTWRAEVGRIACAEGADLLNDAWGGWDPELAAVAAEFKWASSALHTGGATPRTRPHRVHYDDVVADAVTSTVKEAERAAALGVPRESIMIDPGHDFGKNTYHSLELTRNLGKMVDTGWPVLVLVVQQGLRGRITRQACKRKTDRNSCHYLDQRMVGRPVYRVHNIDETRQTLDMVSAIRARPPKVARRGLAWNHPPGLPGKPLRILDLNAGTVVVVPCDSRQVIAPLRRSPPCPRPRPPHATRIRSRT